MKELQSTKGEMGLMKVEGVGMLELPFSIRSFRRGKLFSQPMLSYFTTELRWNRFSSALLPATIIVSLSKGFLHSALISSC
jgi:hypothetical protein